MKSEVAKNPYDIFNAFRTNGSSIHVKACLFREVGNDEEGKPLAAFNNFSRLVVTIIDKKSEIKFVDANIQYEKLAEIEARARFSLEKVFNRENISVTSDSGENSPAYTVVIPSGKLKGKTTAQVMMEPDGENNLKAHYQWLSDNLKNYPKNKVQMEAIVDAVNLAKSGALKKGTPKASTYTILEAEPLPLKRKPNGDGTFPVKEISIICNLAMNSPFEINIVNYDAPVKQGEDGKLNVQKKEKKNEAKKSFKLDIGEFLQLLDHINIAKDIFLNTYSNILIKEAIEADEYNRKNK